MLKLFISQPMCDKTNEEIKAERDYVANVVSEMVDDDIEIIDSFFENAPHDSKPLWFLGKSLQLLSTADIAYFCKGWQDARGCNIEHTCAKEYDIEHIILG